MTIKKISRFIILGALFLVPVFPLIVAFPLFFPFITGKAFYFRILIEIAFAAWLVLAALDPKYRPKWNSLTIGISIFAIVTLVADLLGVNPMRSLWSNFERMEGWVTVIHLWAFYMVASNTFGHAEEGRRMWHRWLNFEIAIAIIVGIYGLIQLGGGLAIHQGSTRIDASLGNAAYMAVYLLWNVGISVYLFFVARMKRIANSGFLVWAYPILAIFFSFLLFETATRGTILGWIGGIVVGLLAYAIFAKSESKKSRMISGGIVAVMAILVIGFWSVRQQPFIQNNTVLSRMANISLSNGETTSRLYIWGIAIEGFKERPILGWGQENFNYVFNEHYNPKLYNVEQWFDRAHSVYFDWLIGSGLIGLLSYVSLYIIFLVIVWKSTLSITQKSVLTGLIAGYAVHNLFVFDNLASYVMFFAALGFVSSFAEGKHVKFLGTKPASAESVEYIMAPLALVALVVVLYFVNIRQIHANTALIAALSNCGQDTAIFEKAMNINAYVANQEIHEQTLSCAGSVIASADAPAATKQAYFNLATKAINDQIASSPMKDARIFMLGGVFMDTAGQYARGGELLSTAHELSPDKQSISLEYAFNLINTHQIEKSVEVLKKAYEDVPTNPQAQSMYALVLTLNGQESVAHELFGTSTEIFETTQMAQAYAMTKQTSKAIALFKKFVAASPTDANLAVQLGQLQFSSGDKAGAIATFRSIAASHPEYKAAIEEAIKQVEAQ